MEAGITYNTKTSITENIEIIANKDKTIVTESNSKSIDGKDFSIRIKMGGTGSVENRNIHCTKVKAGKYKVAWMSGKSGASRNIIISDGTQELLNASNDGKDIASSLFPVNSNGGDVYIYSGSSGINIYGIYEITE